MRQRVSITASHKEIPRPPSWPPVFPACLQICFKSHHYPQLFIEHCEGEGLLGTQLLFFPLIIKCCGVDVMTHAYFLHVDCQVRNLNPQPDINNTIKVNYNSSAFVLRWLHPDTLDWSLGEQINSRQVPGDIRCGWRRLYLDFFLSSPSLCCSC